jgi:hypothetical protein
MACSNFLLKNTKASDRKQADDRTLMEPLPFISLFKIN